MKFLKMGQIENKFTEGKKNRFQRVIITSGHSTATGKVRKKQSHLFKVLKRNDFQPRILHPNEHLEIRVELGFQGM